MFLLPPDRGERGEPSPIEWTGVDTLAGPTEQSIGPFGDPQGWIVANAEDIPLGPAVPGDLKPFPDDLRAPIPTGDPECLRGPTARLGFVIDMRERPEVDPAPLPPFHGDREIFGPGIVV